MDRVHHVLDTDTHVRFYEQEFYPLSNFSSFSLMWRDNYFPTLEHAYHWEKFVSTSAALLSIADQIRTAPSAHEAFTLAQKYKSYRRLDWDDVKEDIMLSLTIEKTKQHLYVRTKLLETDDRILEENSWRDDVWGTGPNGDGQNLLGKCWMTVRDMLREGKLDVN